MVIRKEQKKTEQDTPDQEEIPEEEKILPNRMVMPEDMMSVIDRDVHTQFRQNSVRSPEQDREILNALGSIFFAIVMVDLTDWSVYPVSMPKAVYSYMTGPDLDYRKVIPHYCKISVRRDFHDSVYSFMDPETVRQRLRKHGILHMDYVGRTLGWCRILLIPSKYDQQGNVLHMLYTVQNINKEKIREHEMSMLAEHDPLTGLINRSGFASLVQQLRNVSASVCFVMMDIDYFKLLNDTYGHEAGDSVLKRVAGLLIAEFQETDHIIRMGGDEFAVLITGVSARRCKSALVHKIEQINRQLKTKTDSVPASSISAGAAFSPHGLPEYLYRQADSALYRAKTTNRGTCCFFSSEEVIKTR